MNNLTKQTYEDPEVVQGYIKKNSLNPKQADLIKEFAQKIDGKQVLDLGCGPGHDSYIFAELGFEVVGLDYSAEMIKQAKKFKNVSVSNQPKFIVGDMTRLTDYFTKNQFDAIWASASLLHIAREDIPSVLKGIVNISKPNAQIYISLKQGKGSKIVEENTYAQNRKREFIYWQKDDFINQAKKVGLQLIEFKKRDGRTINQKTTHWLQFFFVNKHETKK